MSRFNESHVEEAALAWLRDAGWQLALDYEDVFGSHFHTVHHKNPQLPWTVCGKGSAPTKRRAETSMLLCSRY